MNITSIINKFLNKKEFYTLLVSTALAWIANLCHIGKIPFLLSIICLFLIISFLIYSWGRLKQLVNNIKIDKENSKKIIEQDRVIYELVRTAFAGMSTMHKMEALKVISELKPLPNSRYKILVKEMHKYTLMQYDNYINNPFCINLNMKYLPLVEINRQIDYCVVTFNPLFYRLVAEHSLEIRNDFKQQYPDAVKYFLSD